MPIAHVVAAERRVVKRLLDAGAVNPRTAEPLPELSSLQRARLRHLMRHGIVLEAGSDKYYVDQGAWEDHRSRQRRLALSLLVVFLIIGFILVAVTRR